ncbi:hypothetical protein ALC57_07164, partial [Trachymyrmex cornetzi]
AGGEGSRVRNRPSPPDPEEASIGPIARREPLHFQNGTPNCISHMNTVSEWLKRVSRALKKDTREATVSGSSSTQVLTDMRVACTDTHVMWARLPEVPDRELAWLERHTKDNGERGKGERRGPSSPPSLSACRRCPRPRVSICGQCTLLHEPRPFIEGPRNATALNNHPLEDRRPCALERAQEAQENKVGIRIRQIAQRKRGGRIVVIQILFRDRWIHKSFESMCAPSVSRNHPANSTFSFRYRMYRGGSERGRERSTPDKGIRVGSGHSSPSRYSLAPPCISVSLTRTKRNALLGNSVVRRCGRIEVPGRAFQQKNLINAINTFLENCYPLSFIFTTVINRIKFHTLNIKTTRNPLIRDKYFTIPYVRSISESFLPISSVFHCKLAFTIPNTLRGLIRRGKDRLNFLSNQNVVYKISCENCDASYVGQTKRKLSTRLKEHQSDIRKNTGSPSVITDHRITFDHNFQWDSVRILDNEPSYGKRLVSEMIHIKRQKHGINKMQDTESLPESYSNIIQALSPS